MLLYPVDCASRFYGVLIQLVWHGAKSADRKNYLAIDEKANGKGVDTGLPTFLREAFMMVNPRTLLVCGFMRKSTSLPASTVWSDALGLPSEK